MDPAGPEMIRALVVGCGPNYRCRASHQETLLDVRPFLGVDVVHDLNVSPWPFPAESFDEVVALHVVEHLEDLIQFMDEAHRVLRYGGALYLETPEAGGDYDLTHADPTHVRCYRRHTFINYFTRSEAPKFGYTDKCWAILDLRTVGGVIRLHASPVKPLADPVSDNPIPDGSDSL